ncbi:MAG: hypothetical protein OHK93_004617 [Ramalina farinacea]|uniref:Uncharacterized protein n=1 Tax=Ramalina farinacea TaxID=258253 RepID=A0AA43QW78_9LECA|nr:hypothetical protein [Ramalina farinacea]
MLERQPAQRFPRSSVIPSLPSARLSLRHSLSRKRRRNAKQLQPTLPLTPIPEVASREVTPTPEEATATTTATATSSAYTSGVTTGFSTTATSPLTAATTSPTEPDDAAAASSPPISPLSPGAGLEVASSTQHQPPSPPTSPATWWLNLPYPTATTTPLPILNAEATPWDPRANWRSSYVLVLKAWELYLARHIGAISPGLTLSLHIPATPPPRLPSPSPPISSPPAPLLTDEDIRWTSTGSPLPPVVPPKEASPPALPSHNTPAAPEAGLEVYAPFRSHVGASQWPLPTAYLPGTSPPSPTPSEPPSPRSSPVEPLSPFPSPALPPPPTPIQYEQDDLPEVAPIPVPEHDGEAPEVVPHEQGGLHVIFAPPPQQQQGRGICCEGKVVYARFEIAVADADAAGEGGAGVCCAG